PGPPTGGRLNPIPIADLRNARNVVHLPLIFLALSAADWAVAARSCSPNRVLNGVSITNSSADHISVCPSAPPTLNVTGPPAPASTTITRRCPPPAPIPSGIPFGPTIFAAPGGISSIGGGLGATFVHPADSILLSPRREVSRAFTAAVEL